MLDFPFFFKKPDITVASRGACLCGVKGKLEPIMLCVFLTLFMFYKVFLILCRCVCVTRRCSIWCGGAGLHHGGRHTQGGPAAGVCLVTQRHLQVQDQTYHPVSHSVVYSLAQVPDRVHISIPISSPNPLFDHLLELSLWDNSNKWLNIRFGEEILQVVSIEVNLTYLI